MLIMSILLFLLLFLYLLSSSFTNIWQIINYCLYPVTHCFRFLFSFFVQSVQWKSSFSPISQHKRCYFCSCLCCCSISEQGWCNVLIPFFFLFGQFC